MFLNLLVICTQQWNCWVTQNSVFNFFFFFHFNNVYCLILSKQYMFGEGNGTPFQYSCLENPMDGGVWKAAVHGVAKSCTQRSDFTFHFSLSCIGGGNGNPLQQSCLENPRGGGACWAAYMTDVTQQQQQQQYMFRKPQASKVQENASVAHSRLSSDGPDYTLSVHALYLCFLLYVY